MFAAVWRMLGFGTMRRSVGLRMIMASMIVLLWAVPAWADEEEPIRVTLDGVRLHFEAAPLLVDGSAYVPMRSVFEAHGARVHWDEASQVVTSTVRYRSVVIHLTDGSIVLNGKAAPPPLKALSVDGRTYVPLRVVSEALGSGVFWEEATRTVRMTSAPLEYILAVPLDLELEANAEARTDYKYNPAAKVAMKIEHYGIRDGKLYTQLQLINMEKETPVSFSFAPVANQRVIGSVPWDPNGKASYLMEDCTLITPRMDSGPDGKKAIRYSTSVDQACVQANPEARAGASVDPGLAYLPRLLRATGNDTYTVRQYLQDEQGGVQKLVVDASGQTTIVLIADAGTDEALVIRGTYRRGEETEAEAFTLQYAVAPALDFGSYESAYNGVAFWEK